MTKAAYLAKALGLAVSDVQAIDTTGLAHEHYRLAGTGKLARVPIHSQHGYPASVNLKYQTACFERVAPSGHGPKFFEAVPVSPELPMGALIVEEIVGRHAKLPDDLDAIAVCLANIHNQQADISPPLAHHNNPIDRIRAEIKLQAVYVRPTALKALNDELNWMRGLKADKNQPEPTRLVCTDTHPGNFLITTAGHAIIVDLEKVLYGSPSVDLAHTSVYSSTTWDINSNQALDPSQIEGFYATYLSHSHHAEAIKPSLIPMRRLLTLRALTWSAMWLHEHKSAQSGWSKDHVPDALTQHVFERVTHYLDPDVIQMNLNQTLELQI